MFLTRAAKASSPRRKLLSNPSLTGQGGRSVSTPALWRRHLSGSGSHVCTAISSCDDTDESKFRSSDADADTRETSASASQLVALRASRFGYSLSSAALSEPVSRSASSI